MPLKKQVCSLELSKKLKELGVPQKSLFYWFKDKSGIASYIEPITMEIFEEEGWEKTDTDIELFSAFTVSELGEMLPMKDYNFNTGIDNKGKWFIMYGINVQEADTEADARAKMKIYLLENNY